MLELSNKLGDVLHRFSYGG